MSKVVKGMVDMALDSKEIQEFTQPSAPRYPYGLCLSLCDDELEKLNLEDLERDDFVHLHCMGKVTSVSTNSTQDGDHKRVEIQIIAIAGSENEADEDEDEEQVMTASKKISKLYTK